MFSKWGNNTVYQYDIETGKTRELLKGYNSKYSNNNNLIAYLPDYQERPYKKLIIRDIHTGKKWEYKTNGSIMTYCFSPDDNYIAIVEKDKKYILQPQYGPIIIWDFKNDKKSTLINNYYGNVIDW